MQQLPQIQPAPAATPTPTVGTPKIGQTDAAGASDQSGEFGDFLDSITEGPLPPALKADLLEQVQAGVPVSEVLANLLDRMREDPELNLVPGMVPVMQTLAPQVELPPEVLGARLAGGRVAPGEAVATTDGEGDTPQLELAAELEGGDLPQGDQLLGKHKALLAGRIAAPESSAAATPALTATQVAAARVLELPAAMAPLAAAAEDVDGPLNQQLLVAPRVGEPQWGQALAQRVIWMVGQEKQSAQLRLNPAHLGPVEVKLTLQQDQASLTLLASNGAARDALEQALPRLRDMLGQQDIQLAHVDVGQRQAQPEGRAQDGSAGADDDQAGTAAGQGAQGDADVAESVRHLQTRGLLDAYA